MNVNLIANHDPGKPHNNACGRILKIRYLKSAFFLAASRMTSSNSEEQLNPRFSTELQQWHPSPTKCQSQEEERSTYSTFHREWVIGTNGLPALNIPFQQFWSDPLYPSHLRDLGKALHSQELIQEQHHQPGSPHSESQPHASRSTPPYFPHSDIYPNSIASQLDPSVSSQPHAADSTSHQNQPEQIPSQGVRLVPQAPTVRQPSTQSLPSSSSLKVIAVIPKNRLTDRDKLVIVQHCLAGAADFRSMGKSEFFLTQREIIKCTEGFDCKVESVMADILVQAKVC